MSALLYSFLEIRLSVEIRNNLGIMTVHINNCFIFSAVFLENVPEFVKMQITWKNNLRVFLLLKSFGTSAFRNVSLEEIIQIILPLFIYFFFFDRLYR